MPQIRPIGISGSIPATNQLALGDLALNVYDGKAYIKKLVDNVESIVELGGSTGQFSISASYAVTASYAETASYATNFVVSGSITKVDYIDFDTGSTVTQPTAGRLSWNNTDGTLDLGLKGGNVTLQIGQETVARVVNKTDGNLLESEFRVVRVRSVAEGGAQGQRLAVVLAQADSDADSATTLGVVTEDIANNQEGFITVFGLVRGINTTGANSWLGLETWVDGDMLYLSPFYPGYLTNVKPTAPNHLVIVGYVEYAHANNGKLFVKIDNGWELGELHDVLDTTTSSSYGDLLIKSGSVWTNSRALTGSYSITGSLTISGSSTFINIGPAIFSGSVIGVEGFTGSFSGSATSALTASFINPLSQSVLITGSLTLVGNELITGSSTWVVPGNASGYISPGTDGISIGNSASGVHIRVRSSNRTALDQSVGIGSPNFGWGNSQNLSIRTGGTTSTYQGILVGNGTNNTIFRVQGNSTVGVNVSDATAALHVQGTGATSSTTALLVQNSNASASLSVRDDGLVTVGGNIALPISSYIYWSDVNSSIQHTGAAMNFRVYQTGFGWNFIYSDSSTIQASINTGFVRARTGFSSTANSPVTMSGWDGGGGTAGNTLLVKGGNSGVGTQYAGGNGADLILENGLATDNSLGFGGTPGSIIFKYGTYNNTASVEYGRLNSSGNFLIGTTAGSAKLLISGSSNSALFEIDSPAVNNILYVSGSGNVGIGTSTPARTLEVNGTIGTTADGVGRGITMGTAVPGGSSYLNVGQGAGWLFHLTTNNATYTANSTRMSITDNGVGFGNFVANGGTVSATAQVRGSGTTSSTTALLIQNANASASFSVKDGNPATAATTGKFQVIAGNWTDSAPYTPTTWRTSSFASAKDITIGSEGILNGYSSRLNFINYYSNGGQGPISDLSGYIRTSIGNYTPVGGGQPSGRGTLLLGVYDTDYNTLTLDSFDVISITKYATIISGSVTATSFTGSLFGTASYAIQALSASYAPSTAAFPFTGSAGISGSLIVNGPITSSRDLLVNRITIGTGPGNISGNTVVGEEAGLSLNGADYDTAVGYQAMYSNTNGYNNTAVGTFAMYFNATGAYNTTIGWGAGNYITEDFNVGIGSKTFNNNPGGSYRVAVGYESQYQGSGNNNTSIGHQTLRSLTTGTGNIAIGYQAGYNETTSNKLYIANSSTTTPLIGGDFANTRLGININPGSTTSTLHVKGSGTTSSTTALLVQNANASSSLVVKDNNTVIVGTGTPTTSSILGVYGNSTTESIDLEVYRDFSAISAFRTATLRLTTRNTTGNHGGQNIDFRHEGINSSPTAVTNARISNFSLDFGNGPGSFVISTTDTAPYGTTLRTKIAIDNYGNIQLTDSTDAYVYLGNTYAYGSRTGKVITIAQQGNVGYTGDHLILRGGSPEGSNNLTGGNLILQGGYSRGTAGSNIILQVPVPSGSSGNVLNTTYRTAIYITGSGNVGIGTSTPTTTLDVSGSGRFTGDVTITGSLTVSGSNITSAWTSYTPTWEGQVTNPSLGDGTLTGAYKVIGKTCFVRIKLNYGSTTTGGSGAWWFGLPFTGSTADGIQMACSMLDNGNAWYQGIANGTYAGYAHKTAIIAQSLGSNSSQGVDLGFPFVWGNTDSLQFAGSYEIA